MKKITLVLCLLVTSFGFAQITLEDFDGPAPTIGFNPGAGGSGGSVAILGDPTGGGNGNVLRIVTSASGQSWQQAELTLQGDFIDMTTADKTISIDWYSTSAITPLLGLATNPGANSPTTSAQAVHTGSGWETLNFDFTTAAQVGPTENRNDYQKVFFFPFWNGAGGWNGAALTTTYVDLIQGPGTLGLINWTGATNSDWNTATNWDNGVVPGPTDPINIPNVANYPTAASAIAISSLSMESGSSFIANGAVTGTVTYERNLSTPNWYYVSSPVVAADVDAFVIASGLEAQATFKALCYFDTGINNWVCYEDGTGFEDTFTSGKGYIVNLVAPTGSISFSGTMNTVDQAVPLDTTGSGYNLLGNPYTSFINTNTMLSANTAILATETIWVFNASTNSYETKVTADNFQLAPGQAFFIRSNGAAGSVAINKVFQSHQGTDTFLRTPERTEVYLTLSDGLSQKNTRIYYIEDTTTGFDNGYDGPMFRAFSDPFSIYTHLVTDGIGRDMGVQSIPKDYENLVVPVGITSASGVEISISANAINLPDGLDLYLEDRANNTFTLLDASSDFTFTPSVALNGVGRFYLHTSNSTLGVNENELEFNLEIYTSASSKELIIKGQLLGLTKAELFDVQGKLVLTKELQHSNNSNAMDISSLTSGVYVVKVNSSNQSQTEKVIIK